MTGLLALLVVDVLVALWIRRDIAKRDWSRRRGDGELWWIVALLLSPLVGVLYLVMRPPRYIRRCPECAEAIQPQAKVCRFCGYRWPVADG